MLVLPLAWALSSVLARPNVAAPAADINRLIDAGAGAGSAPTAEPTRRSGRKLLGFLRALRQGERFLLAVPNAQQAAPLMVRTGESVMALAGYLGRDPILTPERLARLVADGELRYVMLGGPSIVAPDSPQERALAHWVRTHGQRVPSALWRDAPEPSRAQADAALLYDLGPDAPPSEPGDLGP
jgi:4-amino-4-deoxy-L-arabinose transferase-like glycosyltransferase